MRDPKRIDYMLEVLKEAWSLAPDLRFNQLIDSISKGQDCFYEEDDVFSEKIKEWIKTTKNNGKEFLSMIVLRDFLLENARNVKAGCYALVTYNGKTEAIWFSRYINPTEKEDVSFVGSPCRLNKICEVGADIENCYEIEKFDVELYLPDKVDNIKIITEKECLNWMLNATN